MKEFIIHYSLKGEVKIKAENMDDATQRFYDRAGISTDEIYENAVNDIIDYVEEE